MDGGGTQVDFHLCLNVETQLMSSELGVSQKASQKNINFLIYSCILDRHYTYS